MNATIEKVDAVTRKITVTLPSSQVNKELNRAYRNLQREVQMPGFRPGKVPFSILEARHGTQVAGEVRAKLISDTFEAVIEEHDLFVVSQPEVDPGEVRKNQDFTYVATVEIKPEVDATGYLDLTLVKKQPQVQDSDVAQQIEAIRAAKSTLVEIEEDRPLQEDDVARIEYTMETEGQKEPREPRSIHIPVKTHDSSFLPGFADAIMGMTKGETRTFDLEIPEDFHQSSLAGKRPRFTVTLLDIKRYELPDVDDEFAKDLDFETLEDLEADVRKRLEEGAKQESKNDIKKQVEDALLAANPIDLPKGLVAETVNRLAIDQRRRRGERVYGNSVSLTDEEREELTKLAERQLRLSLIVDSIARKEGIGVFDEEIDEYLDKMATETGQHAAALRGQYLKNNAMDDLKSSIREEKVFEFVINKAKISEEGEMPESETETNTEASPTTSANDEGGEPDGGSETDQAE